MPEKPLAPSTTAHPTDHWAAPRWFGALLAVLGAIGLYFSALTMQDKLELAANPDFKPACSVNEVLSCTNVMASSQAATFGFSNPFIGLAGFPVLIVLGVLLAAGGAYPRWMWWGQSIGLGLGVVFVHWLAFESVFIIGALCLYCMAVWAVMLPLFVMSLVRTLRQEARSKGKTPPTSILQPLIVLLAWYAGFAAIIAMEFL